MKSKDKRILCLVAAALILLAVSAFLTQRSAAVGKTEYYQTQVDAAHQLERCFAAVSGYKEEMGIPMGEDDIHRTGMIGLPYSDITTTNGALEAKRTAAQPDMAALCVRMLYEAGVRPGDTVGAGFSGSFPGLNLAVVAACESMDVRLVCIASVGASTYGANDVEITFPEILYRLERDGLIKTKIAAVTMGGYHDVGEDMVPETAEQIKQRLRREGLELVEKEDFQANLEWRESLYRQEGPIDCFIAVGGNVTSLGLGESGLSLGQGVLLNKGRTLRIDESSGLVQRYLVQGIPVIHLLNIKKIMADYSMPYDPADWTAIGLSAVYSSVQYEKGWILAGAGGTFLLLLVCFWYRHRRDTGPLPGMLKKQRGQDDRNDGRGIENFNDR